MPKASTTLSNTKNSRRHNPLEADLTPTNYLKVRLPKRQLDSHNEAENYVNSKASRKILQMGQELVEEDSQGIVSVLKSAFDLESRVIGEYFEVNEEEYEEWGDDENKEVQEVEVADIEAFNKFFPQEQDLLLKKGWGGQINEEDDESNGRETNLADLILDKIAAHEVTQCGNAARTQAAFRAPDQEYRLPEKVVDVYTKVGLILSRYKSGKLPKPFKILPTAPRWEEILEITRPERWTPNACYEATKIFVSSSPLNAQRFIETVILERVRNEIHETKKLNIHLFNCLKKGLYRPAAWFKGFLFPLVGSDTCTLREAHIISAVLVRVSIPVLHSAAAIKGLCDIAAQKTSTETEGGGATNIFIRALLEKKYALPYQVIDALVFHFLRFKNVDSAKMISNNTMEDKFNRNEFQVKESKLPVIWHQCLLAFAQRYRNDITEDQREALLDLLLVKGHHKIGPEVRRELLEGRGRGIPLKENTDKYDGDDTLMSD
ncbi:Uncharacterized protein C13G1.09 [Golovinomyces cichoracearum]|uniref:Uncharacterized protein C13G1.09 n=1 Tax=Golovinomyces cichoracearum TaxID=62708 RepID=A0A420HGB5_9PEZI|nr:Uncharacterized protein C13G1.09 [Golovinomyces cichoracearum]